MLCMKQIRNIRSFSCKAATLARKHLVNKCKNCVLDMNTFSAPSFPNLYRIPSRRRQQSQRICGSLSKYIGLSSYRIYAIPRPILSSRSPHKRALLSTSDILRLDAFYALPRRYIILISFCIRGFPYETFLSLSVNSNESIQYVFTFGPFFGLNEVWCFSYF